MHLSRSQPDSRGFHLSMFATFVAATASFVFVFSAAGVPPPLFNTYRSENGITNADLGHAAVGYFLSAALALVICGRLSDHLGRKPVALLALGTAALACALLLGMHDASVLIVARSLQGLSCGLASTALGSYVVDSATRVPRWLPSTITASAPMVGVSIGAFTCGTLVQYGADPRHLVYEVMLVVLAVCATFIVLGPETIPRSAGALKSLKPQLFVRPGYGALLLATAAAASTWTVTSFYTAFGPSLAADHLGSSSPVVAAMVFSSVAVLNPFGGPLFSKLSPVASLRIAMMAFIVLVAGVVVALRANAIVPFLAASALIGVAQGAAAAGGLRGLLAGTNPRERAGTLAAIYLAAYCGATLPGLVASHFAHDVDTATIFVGYAVLGALEAGVAIVAARAKR